MEDSVKYTGKYFGNCGFQMFDENGTVVYEAERTKFHLFGGSEFEFRNKVTASNTIHRVSGIVSVSSPLSYNRYFKFDSEKIWTFFENRGFTFDSDYSHGYLPTHEMLYKGQKVAVIVTKPLGNRGVMSQFSRGDLEIELKEEYLNMVFLFGFALTYIGSFSD